MYDLIIQSPYIEIHATSIEELESRLVYLNPLCLSKANTVLRKSYGLLAQGSGKTIHCVSCTEPKPLVQVVVISPSGKHQQYSIEPIKMRSIDNM